VWHDTTAPDQSDHFARQTGGRPLKTTAGSLIKPDKTLRKPGGRVAR
jgi:hypothetical protein